MLVYGVFTVLIRTKSVFHKGRKVDQRKEFKGKEQHGIHNRKENIDVILRYYVKERTLLGTLKVKDRLNCNLGALTCL